MNEAVCIDEIQGSLQEALTRLEGPVPVHRAQALCYGMDLSGMPMTWRRIDIQMTYASP